MIFLGTVTDIIVKDGIFDFCSRKFFPNAVGIKMVARI